MKDKKYITVGTPVLSEEIFRSILRPLDNYSYKPNGGLWSCIHSMPEISPWYTYLDDARSIAYYKDIKNASIFTLREKTNILRINSFEELQELIKKYPSYHHILNGYNKNPECIDFEALSKDYAGIIVNPKNEILRSKTNVFSDWSVETLLLFNIGCIESYETITIDWALENIESFPEIEGKSEIKKVERKTDTYITLYNLAESLFIELVSQIKTMSFKDYDEYFEKLVEISNQVMKIIIDSNNIELLELTEKYRNLQLRIEKLHIIRNIVLNILSNFLNANKERIMHLPKSSHTKIKIYKL